MLDIYRPSNYVSLVLSNKINNVTKQIKPDNIDRLTQVKIYMQESVCHKNNPLVLSLNYSPLNIPSVQLLPPCHPSL